MYSNINWGAHHGPITSIYEFQHNFIVFNLHWAGISDHSHPPIILIWMGGCQVGGLKGATPLNCCDPCLIVVSSPSQQPHPPQVIGPSVLSGSHCVNSSLCLSYVPTGHILMAPPYGGAGVMGHTCYNWACAVCCCTSRTGTLLGPGCQY